MRFLYAFFIYAAVLYLGATFKQEIESSAAVGALAFIGSFAASLFAIYLMFFRRRQNEDL